MTEHDPQFITKNFTGPLYDYYPNWYKEVGSILVMQQFIHAFFPYTLLIKTQIMPIIKRCYDRCRGRQKN
jgi:hypothetical protein